MAAESNNNRVTRVLFCGDQFPTSFDLTKQYLSPYPFIQVDAIHHEEVPKVIGIYDICVVRMMRLDASIIALAKNLKLIVQFGMGLEGVDIEAATKFNMKVARIPSDTSGNSLSCAEHAIYLILSLLRDHKGMEKAVKEQRLGVPMGSTLYGKTVFIFGYGNIGKDLAVRLKPFGVRILATRRHWDSKSFMELNKLDENPVLKSATTDGGDDLIDEKGGPDCHYSFAGQADIIVVCTALNSETAGIINAQFLSSMKKGALLVNVARGGILDYAAIKDSLDSGYLGGLGIDVTWFEPFDPADPIVQHPKVIITPHIAGVTDFSYGNMSKVIGDCALNLHNGDQFTGIDIVN